MVSKQFKVGDSLTSNNGKYGYIASYILMIDGYLDTRSILGM
jgi:hypothetical protein